MTHRLAPIRHQPVELDERRCFTAMHKAKLFMRSEGKCEICGTKITGTWIAGHIIAHALGGRTDLDNGRVECPDCAKKTHAEDTSKAAKAERMAGRRGQKAKRKKNGSQFPKLAKEQRKEQYKARKAWAEKVRRND